MFMFNKIFGKFSLSEIEQPLVLPSAFEGRFMTPCLQADNKTIIMETRKKKAMWGKLDQWFTFFLRLLRFVVKCSCLVVSVVA